VGSLRFDTSGLGDSRRPDSTLSANEQFVADTRAAMDAAQSRYGCAQFAMIGFCSGADIAHMTALEDDRLRAVVLFDSYVYPTVRAKLNGIVHRVRRYGALTMLGKLLRYPFRKQVVISEATSGDAPPKDGPVIFGRARMPAREIFGERIRTLVDRGVKVFFIYSGGEPLWFNYHGQFRDTFDSFGFVDKVAYEFLVQSDHTVTQPHARSAVIDLVVRWWQQEVNGTQSSSQDIKTND
jgi:hypothetical protein